MNAVKRHLFRSCEGSRSRRKVLHWSPHMLLSKMNTETVGLFTSATCMHTFVLC